MAAAIALRGDCDSGLLRELAKQSEDADQVRRLLALAVVYDGGSRSDGARAGGVGLQTFRDWVLRFNAAGPTGLVDGKAPGQAPRLDQAQRDELARLIEDGPVPAVHGVVRWRLSDLAQWVMERYRTSVSEQTLSRYLRTMGTANCRPGRAIMRRTCKLWRILKKFPERLAEITAGDAPGKPIEVWFQDEARIGQKNKITRRWAKRGSRPSRRPTNARHRRTSSARSAPSAASAQAWYCRGATTRRWACTSTRFRRPFRPVRTPWCCWIRPAGIPRPS